jgi:hypothetical protein
LDQRCRVASLYPSSGFGQAAEEACDGCRVPAASGGLDALPIKLLCDGAKTDIVQRENRSETLEVGKKRSGKALVLALHRDKKAQMNG